MAEPMYQGHPRSAYDYNGTVQSVYEEWVNGKIDTDRFQTITPYGEGTGALELADSTSPDNVSIVNCHPPSGPLRAGETASATVEVEASYSSETMVVVKLVSDIIPPSDTVIYVPPGGTQTGSLEVEVPESASGKEASVGAEVTYTEVK